MENIFKVKYRIVTDNYLGYEVQSRAWYFPFWMIVGYCNTHRSEENAKNWLCKYLQHKAKSKQKFVRTIDPSKEC